MELITCFRQTKRICIRSHKKGMLKSIIYLKDKVLEESVTFLLKSIHNRVRLSHVWMKNRKLSQLKKTTKIYKLIQPHLGLFIQQQRIKGFLGIFIPHMKTRKLLTLTFRKKQEMKRKISSRQGHSWDMSLKKVSRSQVRK